MEEIVISMDNLQVLVVLLGSIYGIIGFGIGVFTIALADLLAEKLK